MCFVGGKIGNWIWILNAHILSTSRWHHQATAPSGYYFCARVSAYLHDKVPRIVRIRLLEKHEITNFLPKQAFSPIYNCISSTCLGTVACSTFAEQPNNRSSNLTPICTSEQIEFDWFDFVAISPFENAKIKVFYPFDRCLVIGVSVCVCGKRAPVPCYFDCDSCFLYFTSQVFLLCLIQQLK